MKQALLILVFSVVTYAHAQSYLTLSDAQGIANTYYGSLQEMAKHPVGEIQIQNESRLLNVLGVDENGVSISLDFRVPNDLIEVGGGQSKDHKTIPITNYIGRFSRIAEDKSLDFSHKVLSYAYEESPDIKKSNVIQPFVKVVVQKTIKVSNYPTLQINDTMFLNTRNKSVSLITNKYRRFNIHEAGASMSVEELLAQAQNMYSNKRYGEAFKLYQKVLEKNPKHDDAWYYLGVLYYKNQGVGNLSRKQRLQKAYECWKQSNLKKACRAISFITDGREGC